MGSRSRGWCMTLNNYTEDEARDLNVFFAQSAEDKLMLWAIMGFEHCVDRPPLETPLRGSPPMRRGDMGSGNVSSGVGALTPHLQMACYFKNACTFKRLKDINERMHIELMKGSPRQAFDYCTKEEHVVWGEEPTGQGKRSDMKEIKDAALGGASRLELYNMAGSYQAFRFGEIGRLLSFTPRDWKPHVVWIHGRSGIGKTHKAYEMAGPDRWSMGQVLNGFVFSGYEGQENVVFDDFRPDQINFAFLLKILDRYQLSVRTIGGSCEFRGRLIIITTPLSPNETYATLEGESIRQLTRRIDEVISLV